MSADNQPRQTTPPTGSSTSRPGKGDVATDRRGDHADRDVGAALRTVYQKTVDEKVPDEFLDLLGKLG